MNLTLNENKTKNNINNFNLIKLNKSKFEFDNFDNVNFGTFTEINLNNLNQLSKYVSDKLQTLTYYGIEFDFIKKFIIKNKLKELTELYQLEELLI